MDFGSFRDGDALQVSAARECPFSDFLQLRTLRKDDRAETTAIVKCLPFDALHARRYLHLCDAGLVERTFSDLPQLGALCEGHFLQVLAFLEGALFYGLHAGWHTKLCKSASPKRIISYAH